MNWKASPPAIEIAAAAVSVASLGGATCFAVGLLAPLGAGWIAAGVAGACAAVGGGWLIARVDRQPARPYRPVAESADGLALVDDVLLLEERVDAAILPPEEPSPMVATPRVVQLFAVPAEEEEPPQSLVGPGEMIARIEDFLGQSRGVASEPAAARGPVPADDATAALHAALADIRRSLRQG